MEMSLRLVSDNSSDDDFAGRTASSEHGGKRTDEWSECCFRGEKEELSARRYTRTGEQIGCPLFDSGRNKKAIFEGIENLGNGFLALEDCTLHPTPR